MLILCCVILTSADLCCFLYEFKVRSISNSETKNFIFNRLQFFKHTDLAITVLINHLDTAFCSFDFTVSQNEYALPAISIELGFEQFSQRTVKVRGFGPRFHFLYLLDSTFQIDVIFLESFLLTSQPLILFGITYD